MAEELIDYEQLFLISNQLAIFSIVILIKQAYSNTISYFKEISEKL